MSIDKILYVKVIFKEKKVKRAKYLFFLTLTIRINKNVL